MKLKELELAIVRVAEREPNRVGLAHTYTDDPNGCSITNHCILGKIGCDKIGANATWNQIGDYIYSGMDSKCLELASNAARLNNEGVPWGQIPVILGLVPGEQPAEVTTTGERQPGACARREDPVVATAVLV